MVERPKQQAPYTPNIKLDRSSPIPLYHQISAPIERLITSGELETGRLIEDEVSLAQRLNVSRPTARRALQDLVNRGLLTRRRGVGTRVTPAHVHRPLSLTSLNEDLIKAGFDPKTEVISYETCLAHEKEASFLNCATGAEIVKIERLRWIDDRPLALMTNYLPAAQAPTLTELSKNGLYACLAAQGVALASAFQRIGARVSEVADQKYLKITPGSVLLTMQRTAYDSAGEIVEYGSHVYNATLYSFQLNLAAD